MNVRDVGCPRCGAAPGASCTSTYPLIFGSVCPPHAERDEVFELQHLPAQ